MRPFLLEKPIIIFLFLLLFYSCQRPCAEANYTGKWQFTTVYSTNSQPPHNTKQRIVELRSISSDSIEVDYNSYRVYVIEVDCRKGTLEGDIYAGNHGWRRYKGAITDSTLELTISGGSGFPPNDTTHQVIRGIKL